MASLLSSVSLVVSIASMVSCIPVKFVVDTNTNGRGSAPSSRFSGAGHANRIQYSGKIPIPAAIRAPGKPVLLSAPSASSPARAGAATGSSPAKPGQPSSASPRKGRFSGRMTFNGLSPSHYRRQSQIISRPSLADSHPQPPQSSGRQLPLKRQRPRPQANRGSSLSTRQAPPPNGHPPRRQPSRRPRPNRHPLSQPARRRQTPTNSRPPPVEQNPSPSNIRRLVPPSSHLSPPLTSVPSRDKHREPGKHLLTRQLNRRPSANRQKPPRMEGLSSLLAGRSPIAPPVTSMNPSPHRRSQIIPPKYGPLPSNMHHSLTSTNGIKSAPSASILQQKPPPGSPGQKVLRYQRILSGSKFSMVQQKQRKALPSNIAISLASEIPAQRHPIANTNRKGFPSRSASDGLRAVGRIPNRPALSSRLGVRGGQRGKPHGLEQAMISDPMGRQPPISRPRQNGQIQQNLGYQGLSGGRKESTKPLPIVPGTGREIGVTDLHQGGTNMHVSGGRRENTNSISAGQPSDFVQPAKSSGAVPGTNPSMVQQSTQTGSAQSSKSYLDRRRQNTQQGKGRDTANKPEATGRLLRKQSGKVSNVDPINNRKSAIKQFDSANGGILKSNSASDRKATRRLKTGVAKLSDSATGTVFSFTSNKKSLQTEKKLSRKNASPVGSTFSKTTSGERVAAASTNSVSGAVARTPSSNKSTKQYGKADMTPSSFSNRSGNKRKRIYRKKQTPSLTNQSRHIGRSSKDIGTKLSATSNGEVHSGMTANNERKIQSEMKSQGLNKVTRAGGRKKLSPDGSPSTPTRPTGGSDALSSANSKLSVGTPSSSSGTLSSLKSVSTNGNYKREPNTLADTKNTYPSSGQHASQASVNVIPKSASPGLNPSSLSSRTNTEARKTSNNSVSTSKDGSRQKLKRKSKKAKAARNKKVKSPSSNKAQPKSVMDSLQITQQKPVVSDAKTRYVTSLRSASAPSVHGEISKAGSSQSAIFPGPTVDKISASVPADRVQSVGHTQQASVGEGRARKLPLPVEPVVPRTPTQAVQSRKPGGYYYTDVYGNYRYYEPTPGSQHWSGGYVYDANTFLSHLYPQTEPTPTIEPAPTTERPPTTELTPRTEITPANGYFSIPSLWYPAYYGGQDFNGQQKEEENQ